MVWFYWLPPAKSRVGMVSIELGSGHCEYPLTPASYLFFPVKVLVLIRKKVAYPLQAGGEFPPQVEKFEYLGILFMSEVRMEREIN